MHNKHKGFTIVELLIVIVVIAILAAISIVAYNGIQERARYSSMQSDIASIDKAIQLFYVDKGYYPYTGTAGGNTTAGSTGAMNIPGLIPDYIQKIPPIPNDGKNGYYAYVWSANGADYKLLRLATSAANLPAIEQTNPKPDPNPLRAGRGWGTWSSGGSNL